MALFCVVSLLLAGCATNRNSGASKESGAERQSRLLRGHDFEAAALSTEPGDGLVPTGVWRIQGDHNIVYLAATTHIVPTNQVPYPSTYYAAYRDSKEIYLEVDDAVSGGSSLGLTFKMYRWLRSHRADFFYPKGKTLADDLSPETLERVKAAYGKEYGKVAGMRPVFVVFMAQVKDMGEQFVEEGGVEDVFASRARLDGKPIRTLDDSSINQVVLLALDEMVYEIQNEINKSGADKAVSEAVFGSSEPIDERDWRRGDLAAAMKEVEEMKEEAPDLYEKIGPERNRKWLPKIKKALKGANNAMIFAGVAHFPGPNGLIELLRNEGFTVEQLYGVDPIL